MEGLWISQGMHSCTSCCIWHQKPCITGCRYRADCISGRGLSLFWCKPKNWLCLQPGAVFVALVALQLLQVANYMRRTGYFVVAALTRPFEFEGRRKLEEADALIEALQDVAQLVVSSRAPATLLCALLLSGQRLHAMIRGASGTP